MKKSILTTLEAGTPIGAGGSRLLRGNCKEHECLEAEAARFFGAQTALFLGGPYFASLPVLTMAPQRHDLPVLESLVHASPGEEARAGRAAFRICAHKDPQAIESESRDWRAAGGAGQVWIVVESLYSMDSDLGPLEDLLTIADRHDAFLVVGEAHASGVCSEQGRGLTAPYEGRTNLLAVHRCGKALGAAGALVTASGVLRDFLIKCCCPFIFATAPSPLMALAVREALLILEKEAERQQRLAKLVAFTHLEMVARGEGSPSNSQILPYFVAENARAMRLSSAPHAPGFDIRGMRPQTVPASTACLRSLLGEHEGRAMLDALTVETRGGSR
ncbi:8-amino-7-oxononanoate synthase [Bradyrhizobium sp. LA6.10]